jgi:hypothetical protein
MPVSSVRPAYGSRGGAVLSAPRARLAVQVLRSLAPAVLALSVLLGYAAIALLLPHGPVHAEGGGLGYTGSTALHPLLRWDGSWYTGIAEHGYQHLAGRYQPYAFFPLLPVLAAALHAALPLLSLPAAGIAVNIVAVCLAAQLIDRTLQAWSWWQRLAAVALAVTLPSAFFYATFYSEALFLLAVALTLWALADPSRLRWAPVGIVLATLDRPPGILLVLLLLPVLWRSSRSRTEKLVLLAASGCGLAALLVTFAVVAGDPLAFVTAQGGWTSLRTLGIADGLRWLLIYANPFAANPVVSLGYWEVYIAAALLWRFRRRLAPIVPYCAAALAVCFVSGGVGTQSRYVLTLLPLWLGLLGLLRERTDARAWRAVAVALGAGVIVNVWLMDRFVRGVWAG